MRIFWCETDPWLALPSITKAFSERTGISTADFFCHEDLVPHAAGRFLLLRALRQYRADCVPALSYEIPGGKPYISGGPAFSISHAGNVAVCACSERQLGIDIEVVSAMAQPPLHVLQPEELAYLRGFTEEHRDRAFCQLWTQKESLLKAQGRVLADLFLQESVITPDLRWKDYAEGFFLHRLDFLEPEYAAAVSMEIDEMIEITRLELPGSIRQLSELLHWGRS